MERGEGMDRSAVAVLFVDDEENILHAIERLFFDEEFQILTASSGAEGLSILAGRQDVAVIVSDQRMPQMSGADFLEKSREIAPDAVRMVLTGYADITAAMDAVNKGGAARYLTKPWDDRTLLQTVRDGVDYFLVFRENRRLTEVIRKQNEELEEWNRNLKRRVMEQTTVIRKQNEELSLRSARLAAAFDGMIESFSLLLELMNPRLRNHARNVAELSVTIGRELGVSAEELETIRRAALLHDIGIIGMPPHLFGKRPSEMTPEELRLFQQHPVRGQTAIDAVEELRPAGVLIRHHHEQYNGNGYPDRLAKDAIPLGARIIGFANYIDREIGDRRGGDALESVFTRVNLHLGLLFDPLLLYPARKGAKYLYFDTHRVALGVENEYPPAELVSGMVVTRDLYSGTGLLLIRKGVLLDRSMIDSIRRYYEIDPPPHGVYAMIGGGVHDRV
ncbi:MAG: response regulator [Desulfuromonadia bacterium]